MNTSERIESLRYAIYRAEFNIRRCKYEEHFFDAEKYEMERDLLKHELEELEASQKNDSKSKTK
jgi:hypothetical protein